MALLAGDVMVEFDPVSETMGMIIGSVTSTTHFTKAGVRVLLLIPILKQLVIGRLQSLKMLLCLLSIWAVINHPVVWIIVAIIIIILMV